MTRCDKWCQMGIVLYQPSVMSSVGTRLVFISLFGGSFNERISVGTCIIVSTALFSHFLEERGFDRHLVNF